MNCLITIKDYHNTDGTVEKAELTVPAEINGSSGDYSIVYTEQTDELAGCLTKMHVTDGKRVEIQRTGSYNTEMTMEKGLRSLCCYDTPMGKLMMGVYTSRVESAFTENRLQKLDFTYTLDFNNELVSKNRIKIIAEYKEM